MLNAFRARLAMARAGGPVDAVRFGARFRLHPVDNLTERRLLLAPDRFEPLERAWLRRMLPPDAVFVDVGANVGAHALSVAAQAARIVAIEPEPVLFARLEANVALNGFSNVAAFACAVADFDGEATLFSDRVNRGESALSARPVSRRGEARRVRVRTLATIVETARLERIDALKVDVEGFEDRVLAPFLASASPALLPRAILVEANAGWRLDLPAWLRRRGYAQVLRTKRNAAYELAAPDPRRRERPRPHE